jgi:dephospho-CoA kinase
LTVALTGGIASGKGAVTERFARHGVPVFDADRIARNLVQAGAPALAEIGEAFGAQMLLADGTLDRARMRELIFADPVSRGRLEAILHPRVRTALLAEVQACSAAYCLMVIPLLTEVQSDYDFIDRVLVVDASPLVQHQRLMLRDRCTAETATTMIAAQAPRAARLAIATDVIDNDGAIAQLDPIVERLHATYLAIPDRVSAAR